MNNLSPNFRTPEVLAVCEVLDRLRSIGLRKGMDIKVYSDRSLKNYLNLTSDQQISIIDNLELYVSMLEETPSMEKETDFFSVEDDIDTLKFALDNFKFRITDDDYSFIEEGDLIEIYNIDNIQIWRNLALLEINVFDLLTVLTEQWFDLYERSEEVTKVIIEKATRVLLDEKITTRVPCDVPTHALKAKSDVEEATVIVRFKWFVPLFHQVTGRKVAFLLCQRNDSEVFTGVTSQKIQCFPGRHKNSIEQHP